MIKGQDNRKIYIFVFLIVIIIFLSSVILVFVMQGKRLDGGEIIQTGAIKINTIPSDVDAFINDQKVSMNEKVIQSVPIGEVKLTLTKEGYTSWSKKLSIKPGVVKNVSAQLFPEQFNLVQFSEQDVDKLTYSRDYEYMFFTVLNSEISSENGVWKAKLSFNTLDIDRNSKPELVVNLNSEQIGYLKEKEYKIIASNNDDKVLVFLKESDLLWEIDVSDKTINSLGPVLGFTPDDISFLGKSDDLLITKTSSVYTLSADYTEKNLISLDIESSKFVCNSEDTIYYFDKNLSEIFKVENGKHEPILANLVKGFGNIDSIWCAKDNRNVIVISSERGLWYIDLKDKVEELFALSGEIKEIASNGNSIRYLQEGRLFTANRDTSEVTLKLKNKEILENTAFEFKYTNDGLGILKFDSRNLFLLDIDAENPFKLIEDISFDINSIGVLNNRKEIFGVIENTPIAEQVTTSQQSVYKIALD